LLFKYYLNTIFLEYFVKYLSAEMIFIAALLFMILSEKYFVLVVDVVRVLLA